MLRREVVGRFAGRFAGRLELSVCELPPVFSHDHDDLGLSLSRPTSVLLANPQRQPTPVPWEPSRAEDRSIGWPDHTEQRLVARRV